MQKENNNDFKVWWIFADADFTMPVDPKYLNNRNCLVMAEYTMGDQFKTLNGQHFYLWNEENKPLGSKEWRIEVLCVDDFNSQDEINMHHMLYPTAGFDNLTIEMVRDFKASHQKV